jgi:2,6-dihydroxypseudooxynicotine hydrolase
MDLSIEGHAAKISRPLLVVMGMRDRLFPYSDAERLVDEAAGPTELLLLEHGNHGCANVIYRHRPYSADWMAQRLHAPGSTPDAR